MGLISFLADLRALRLVDELNQQLARRAYGLLRDICEMRVTGMSQSEARGYVWAKARRIVAAEVAATAARYPLLGQATLVTLHERTHDRVVRAVVSDLIRERSRHIGRRRAA